MCGLYLGWKWTKQRSDLPRLLVGQSTDWAEAESCDTPVFLPVGHLQNTSPRSCPGSIIVRYLNCLLSMWSISDWTLSPVEPSDPTESAALFFQSLPKAHGWGQEHRSTSKLTALLQRKKSRAEPGSERVRQLGVSGGRHSWSPDLGSYRYLCLYETPTYVDPLLCSLGHLVIQQCSFFLLAGSFSLSAVANCLLVLGFSLCCSGAIKLRYEAPWDDCCCDLVLSK